MSSCVSFPAAASSAFEEYYEGPTEFAAGDALGSFGGLLKSTWERAVRNGQFEETDAEQLTDWCVTCLGDGVQGYMEGWGERRGGAK